MIYLGNNKIKDPYLGDKKLNKIYLGDKLVWHKPTFNANGHDFVEIAGIKWATMNVGANKVTDYGLYFQWGDIQGYTQKQIKEEHKKAFSWSDYKFTTDGGHTFTKYNSTDGYKELTLEDDAVHAAWKGSWRMPTTDEFAKLGDAVDTEWTDNYNNSGVAGLLCTDKNDKAKTLFLPACGYADNGSMSSVGSDGSYWSSSLVSSSVGRAYYLDFSNGRVDWQGDCSRYYGFTVRGVLAEN